MMPLPDALSPLSTSGTCSGVKSTAGNPRHWLTSLTCSAQPDMDPLNRALVAGLMLEVMLANPGLAEEPGSQGHRLKACLKTSLASHLAGHISLASFNNLAQGLDHWFEVIFPVLANAGLAAGHHATPPAPGPAAPGNCPLREDLFTECLKRTPGLLPHRRHRKLDPEKLRNFFRSTGGNWFRLRDFEGYFQVDRKTAWEYVQKLLQAGLLLHNQGHSSAVRYQVAPRFLQPAWDPPAGQAASASPTGRRPDRQVPLHS